MLKTVGPEISAKATRERAYRYVDAGLSVIPLKLDGSKSPAISSWKPYANRLPTADEIYIWFSRTAGIGLITGTVSGGVEVIDFDMANLIWPLLSMLDRSLADRLSIYETPGGWHLIYRCSEICGNTKIAMWEPIHTPSRGKCYGPPGCGKGVRIETRGEGGYIVAEGSPFSVHMSGRPYVHYMGPTLEAIETISPGERRSIWMAASEFDLSGQRDQATQAACKQMHQSSKPIDLETPWDWFDRCGSWDGLLCPLGWKRSGDHWTRPGKANGISASIGTNTDGVEVLSVWSTSANLQHKHYGKFNALVELHHRGNRTDAIRAVRTMMEVSR
jgi:hypothetical protein